MVRVKVGEQPSEEKRERPVRIAATKNKVLEPPPKANSTATIWPCQIDGCNKQFAREADLKRHQRTTKIHSMPGYACPQCDSTFTRPDALRRHQKGRHNGVILDPSDNDKSGSKSRSNSTSPTTEFAASTAPQTFQGTSSIGPGTVVSTYYRAHTGDPKSAKPVMDPQFAQVSLPTSATRLNPTPNWNARPWPESAPPPPPPASSSLPPGAYPPPPPMYYAPYYRRNGSHHPSSSREADADSASTSTSSPVIESTRDLSPGNDHDHDSDQQQQIREVLLMPAIQVAMDAALREISEKEMKEEDEDEEIDELDTEDVTVDDPQGARHAGHKINGGGGGGGEMDNILTEDGEPMLNPAELLTQESLASPSPS